ncbi:MAG: type III-A CRISPR-associated protein Cas10/Csm1 [Pseudomonadota bacterium]
MDDTVYKIAMAGMLHDIGKFMQRAEVPLSDASKRMEYTLCPVYKGFYSHKHVLWTNEFFNLHESHRILGATKEFDSIANLASYHHNASNKMQEIIQLADRLSSGSDRVENEEEADDKTGYKKTRLHSILEYMAIEHNDMTSPQYRYELHPLDDKAENCFPVHSNSLSPPDGDLLVNAYGQLWDEFQKDSVKLSCEDIPSFVTSLLSLLEKHTWCIPSSTIDRPDISLFDHAKTTAAIAVALYLYHIDRGDLKTAQMNTKNEEKKYILLVGDLSGIQNYIFNIKNVGVGGTAKRLRARSFFLSLLSDIAAHKILHAFSLPLTNLLMSSGGKFYLMLPNIKNAPELLQELRAEFDTWCMRNLNGEVAVNTAYADFSCAELLQFNQVLKTINDKLQQAKNAPFKSYLSDSKGWKQNAFMLEHVSFKDEESLCKSCNKFAGVMRQEQDIVMCDHCYVDVNLGRELVSATNIQLFNRPAGSYKIFDYSFTLLRKGGKASRGEYLQYQLNNWSYTDNAGAIRPKYFANHVPTFDNNTCKRCNENNKSECMDSENAVQGNPMFFSCLAQSSRGRKALGILKADVDNLGLIFIKGFRAEQEKAISRITTLSRLLDTFFTGRLDYILRSEFSNLYTVYAGGDDLLVLGPWSDVIQFSMRLRSEFDAYCCRNPDFTLSAGMSVVKPRIPIYAAIDAADMLLDEAKHLSALGEEEPKDQMAALGDCFKWDMAETVLADAEKMAGWQEQKKISMGFARLLLTSGEMYRTFKQTGETKHLKFSPLLAYSIARNISSKENELLMWAQDLTDIANEKLNNLVFIANYSISINRR